MNCPKCLTAFKQELYENIEIDKCISCSGTWLDSGELSKIITTHSLSFSKEQVIKTLKNAFKGLPENNTEGKLYCPKCNLEMKKNNYDFKSGIIVDVCVNGHGIWLDNNELEKIQIHREHWENDTKKNKNKLLALINKVGTKYDKIYSEKEAGHIKNYIINSMFKFIAK